MKFFGIAFLIFVFTAVLNMSYGEIISSAETVQKTWNGFKHYFITEDGRVKRPQEDDTVSEGQAYAMLRAVWLDDKETFDNCYRWTETHLSRQAQKYDHLLAWHWKDGKVTDWMPASDADIDYALSLIFACSRWADKTPKGLTPYGDKAGQILRDVLKNETFRTAGGRLYLSPWIINKTDSMERFPLNPSYFSPAQFRIFHQFSSDDRWLELADSTYFMLNSLCAEFNGKKGSGLVPDWCAVDNNDIFYPLEGKNSDFGPEAIRVFYRIALDYFWFGSPSAERFLKANPVPFIEAQFRQQKAVYCEYSYDGKPLKKYENPGFYSCYACVLLAANSEYLEGLMHKNQSYIRKDNDFWIYQGRADYYPNCLAWYIDGLKTGTIKNLFKETDICSKKKN